MRIAIYGAGGFGRQLVAQHPDRIAMVIDDHPTVEQLCGVPVVRRENVPATMPVLVAVSDPETKRRLAENISNPAGSIYAPTALIARETEIGEGAALCEMTQMVGFSRIGRHFHCNIYSYVAHDCIVGDYVTLAPRVSVNGNVTIGDGVYIGTGAIIRQGVTIGDGAFISMGALVSKDVPAGARVIGSRIFPGDAVVPLKVA